MDLLKFGEYTAPGPTEYSVEVSDVDAEGTGRGENGILQRDRVRGGANAVHKIDIAWTCLTDAENTQILKAVEGESVNVRFYFAGEYLTKQMYASNRKVDLVAGTADDPHWNLSFSMTEY